MPLKTAGSANTIGLLALRPRRSHCFLWAHLSSVTGSQFLSAKGGDVMWAACPAFLF